MSISLTHWWFCHIQAARQTVRQTDTGTKIKSERGGGGEIGSEGDRDKKFSNTRNKKSSDACEHIVSDVTWSSFSGVRSFSTSDSLAQATQPVRVALACPQGSHLHIQNHLKALSAASVMFLFLMALLIFAPSMPNAEVVEGTSHKSSAPDHHVHAFCLAALYSEVTEPIFIFGS